MLQLTQARGIFRNPQYVTAISKAVEILRSSILRAKMYLTVLQLPAGLRQAQVKQIQLSTSRLSYQKDPFVGCLQS